MTKVKHFFSFLFVLAAAVAMPTAANAQSSDDFQYGFLNHGGLQFGAGSEGISIGLGAIMGPFLELGLGVNLMPSFTISGDMKFNNAYVKVPQMDDKGFPVLDDNGSQLYNTYDLGTVKVSGKFERITFDAKLNLYPFGPRSTFFVAGGVSLGGERLAKLSGHSDEVARIYDENKYYVGEIEAVVDKSYLDIAKNGNIDGEIRVKKVRPYVGVGFGRLVPRHGMGVRLEMGLQFTDHIKIYQNDTQVPIEEYLQRADDRLSKLIDRMTVYPVLKLSVAGTFM